MLQKNIFCLHFAKLRDYFFSVQNEHTISSLCKVNRLVSSLQKGKTFFYCSANLRDYLFILKSKQIGFFTAESEDILFPQCQFNRLFLYCRMWRDCFFTAENEEIVSSLQKVKTFFFHSANLTDCFFTAESEEIVSLLQKVKRLFLYCRKWRDCFFTAESEDVLFPQCQFNRFFTAESEEIVSLLQKVKMFFFHSANLTDSFL